MNDLARHHFMQQHVQPNIEEQTDKFGPTGIDWAKEILPTIRRIHDEEKDLIKERKNIMAFIESDDNTHSVEEKEDRAQEIEQSSIRLKANENSSHQCKEKKAATIIHHVNKRGKFRVGICLRNAFFARRS